MVAEWGFIKRLGKGHEARSKTILSDVKQFELPVTDSDDNFSPVSSRPSSPVFSLKSAASSTASLSSLGSIKRLGSILRKETSDEKASVLFDADEHLDTDSIHAPDHTPAPTNSPTRLGRASVGDDDRPHITPSRSALAFLQRVSELDVKTAIEREVRAIQIMKVNDFSDAWKKEGIDAAIEQAVDRITDQGSNGRPRNPNVINALQRLNRAGGSLDASHRANFYIEELQNFHHRGSKGANLSSAEIAENFQKNGANLHAAELALAFIESSHDYIQATEFNSPDRAVKREIAKPSAPSAEPQIPRGHYDKRSRAADAGR